MKINIWLSGNRIKAGYHFHDQGGKNREWEREREEIIKKYVVKI